MLVLSKHLIKKTIVSARAGVRYDSNIPIETPFMNGQCLVAVKNEAEIEAKRSRQVTSRAPVANTPELRNQTEMASMRSIELIHAIHLLSIHSVI